MASLLELAVIVAAVLICVAIRKIFLADPVEPTPCPYCPNQDRNSVFDKWSGCQHKGSGGGEDPPCVCDDYPTTRQLARLGLGR